MACHMSLALHLWDIVTAGAKRRARIEYVRGDKRNATFVESRHKRRKLEDDDTFETLHGFDEVGNLSEEYQEFIDRLDKLLL